MAHPLPDSACLHAREGDARCKLGRLCGIDRVREALEPVPRPAGHALACTRGDHGNQDVLDAPIAPIVHHREPEFSALIGRDPEAQNLAFPFWRDAQGHINKFVLT